MTPLLEARAVGLPCRLGPTNLQLLSGTLTALIGPNGGGKTSLLRTLARIDGDVGSVRIDGEDVTAAPPTRRRQLLSFLPASREMAWPISAQDVIALGLERPDARRVQELLRQLELEPLAERPADRLSTGERTRVLLGRALAARPRVLLLDEPLSNLDPYWVLRILALIREYARSGSAALVALHDLGLLGEFDRALLVADRRILIEDVPARVLADTAFEQAFRVRPDELGARFSLAANPRSLR